MVSLPLPLGIRSRDLGPPTQMRPARGRDRGESAAASGLRFFPDVARECNRAFAIPIARKAIPGTREGCPDAASQARC